MLFRSETPQMKKEILFQSDVYSSVCVYMWKVVFISASLLDVDAT